MSDIPSSIPNVSFVMKELTGLSSQVDSLLRKNDSRSNPVDPVLLQQQILGMDSSYSKEQKHRELMSRMRKSVEETRSILHGGSTPSTQTDFRKQKLQQSFVIPHIKYRHLEKQQEEPPTAKSTKLINEFYQTEHRKDCATQYEQEQEQFNAEPTLMNFACTAKSNLTASQPNNYEDTLQRYYDICTRRRRNVGEQKPLGRTGSKFTRTRDNEQGVEKAMRVLLQR